MPLVALLLIAACSSNNRPSSPEPVYLTTSVVASSDVCMNIDNCPAFAPYFRQFEDQSAMPVWWLISTDNRACRVTPQIYTRADALTGKVVACNWRTKRGAPR